MSNTGRVYTEMIAISGIVHGVTLSPMGHDPLSHSRGRDPLSHSRGRDPLDEATMGRDPLDDLATAQWNRSLRTDPELNYILTNTNSYDNKLRWVQPNRIFGDARYAWAEKGEEIERVVLDRLEDIVQDVYMIDLQTLSVKVVIY